MLYEGKYSLKKQLINEAPQTIGQDAQARVQVGANAEETAHLAYGIPFKGLQPAGTPDLVIPGKGSAEVKNVNRSRLTFAMELTSGSYPKYETEKKYSGVGIRNAAKASEPTWGQASIPNPTVKEVIKQWCADNNDSPTALASRVKKWYLGKAKYLVAVIDNICYEIPIELVTIRNDDNEANAYSSYGSGPRIKIEGQIPADYKKYTVVNGKIVDTSKA